MTLTIAIPSKGRLKEQCQDVLAAAGFTVKGGTDSRNYQGRIEGRDDVEVAFLSASEISREVAKGSVHLGITGEDLVQENIANYNQVIAKIQPLGFGHADVIVALPESWIDVDTMADLDDVAADYRQRYGRRLRVATKYWSLTQRFFEKKGIVTYRIVESLGATEGAPAAGLADVIVDITTTGSTLRANHLKIITDGYILRSQATLFASRKASLSDTGKRAAEALAAGLAASIDPVTLRAEFFDESLMKQEKVSEIF